MTNKELMKALDRELEILMMNRQCEVSRAKRLLEDESTSVHLGHNLASCANDITRYNGQIEAVNKTLFGLRRS